MMNMKTDPPGLEAITALDGKLNEPSQKQYKCIKS